jgi:hypothetical protein
MLLCRRSQTESLRVVALASEQLLEVRFAIEFALQRGIVAEFQSVVAMQATETFGVIHLFC